MLCVSWHPSTGLCVKWIPVGQVYFTMHGLNSRYKYMNYMCLWPFTPYTLLLHALTRVFLLGHTKLILCFASGIFWKRHAGGRKKTKTEEKTKLHSMCTEPCCTQNTTTKLSLLSKTTTRRHRTAGRLGWSDTEISWMAPSAF